MASFTLDDIRKAADAKYGSTDIQVDDTTTVVLRNPLRLSKDERAELSALQNGLDDDGDDAVDQAEILQGTLRLVATNKKDVEKLLKAAGDDLAVLAQIVESYGKGVQVGEA